MVTAWTVADYVSKELSLDLDVSRNIVELFEDGQEIPFIARYRRYLTKDATPDDLRHALKAFNDAKALKVKAEKFIKKIDSAVDASDYQKESLKSALSRTMDEEEFEHLVSPFRKSKTKSRAAIAGQLGVDPLCQRILRGEYINFHDYVDSSREGLESNEKVEKAVIDYLSSYLHQQEATQSFLAAVTNNPERHTIVFKVKSVWSSKGKKLEADDYAEFKRYELYSNFLRPEKYVKDHQILAIQRGCKQGFLKWSIEIVGHLGSFHPGLRIPVHRRFIALLERIVADSTQRFFIPSIERTLKKRLLARAEQSAIDCFASNVRELFLTAPLKGKPILAIDPGVKHGCKCALTDAHGKVLDTAVLFWCQKSSGGLKLDKSSEDKLISLVMKASSDNVIIAIGNGKENCSVQKAVSSLIQEGAFASVNVEFCVISECGSSVYSASPIAVAEFPKMDINLRSAVSIARRVLDPISEYVKIPPESLGVGSYQHSVNSKRLREMLEYVVRESVSTVGVDVNVASCQVLEKVAGLNKKTAANIIKYRNDVGRISDRETLKKISGIGPKSFEQCAGFLYVFDDSEDSLHNKTKRRRLTKKLNPLDSTPVHPESYHIAEKIVASVNASLSDIKSNEFRSKLLSCASKFPSSDPQFHLVWELLCRPTLTCNPPKLFKNLSSSNSVEAGQVVEGIVTNHTQFGAFIDIGIGINGLLHVSRFRSNAPPKVNSRVKVLVRRIDLEAKRIELDLSSDL